jgi:hypothetical protein
MRGAIVTEFVDLCEQIVAAELVEPANDAEQALYGRLDQLWYVEMADDERYEAEDRLIAKARAWHDARRAVDP